MLEDEGRLSGMSGVFLFFNMRIVQRKGRSWLKLQCVMLNLCLVYVEIKPSMPSREEEC